MKINKGQGKTMEQKRQKTEAAEFFTAKNVVRSMYDKVEALEGNAGCIGILKPRYVKGFVEKFARLEY